jgi:hypothetical protein
MELLQQGDQMQNALMVGLGQQWTLWREGIAHMLALLHTSCSLMHCS